MNDDGGGNGDGGRHQKFFSNLTNLLPCTVTVKLHSAVNPTGSIAVYWTIVIPSRKLCPLSILDKRVTCLLLSVAEGSDQFTRLVEERKSVDTVMSLGHCPISGGVPSKSSKYKKGFQNKT